MHATPPCSPPAAGLDRSADLAERRRLRHEMRQAAQDGGFTLSYQPRCRLSDGAPIGAQVQPAWPRRRRGVASAAAFMQLVDNCGLGALVTTWMLDTACKAAQAWPLDGQASTAPPVAVVVVGVDGHALEDGSLLGQVASALTGSGLAPERLEIVIAESSFAQSQPADPAGFDDALLTMAALRDAGVGVALEIGRYGIDLLSLSRLPLNSLTLDRAMIRDLPTDRHAASMVRAVIATAQCFGIEVVAAGLETDAQRLFLRELGCHAAQGPWTGHMAGAA